MYVYMVATAHWSPWGEILVSIRNMSHLKFHLVPTVL